MIYVRTKLDVADNSGAKRVSFIGLSQKNRVHALIGDVFTANVKAAYPMADKKGEVVPGVLVRTSFSHKRERTACA